MMKNFELIRELSSEPIVTKATIKRIVGCDDRYAYTILNRLRNRGIIKQIKKGRYTALDDIYIISTNMYTPSYLCLWSASSYKGYTEQILGEIQVAVTREHKEVEFNNYRITPIRFSEKIFFGFQKLNAGNFSIFIAEDEKLLIDSLLFPERMGNPEEIKKVFKNAEIDEGKLVNYLKRIGNKSLIKRCCFLLERIRGIDLSDNFQIGDRNYIPLFSKKGKKIDSKWRIRHDL